MGKPFQSYQEYQVDRALESAISDPESIRKIRPVHPQVLMPERHGYGKQVLDVTTVLNVNRYVASNRSWLSGMPVMNNQITDDSFEGSGRYSMGALWT